MDDSGNVGADGRHVGRCLGVLQDRSQWVSRGDVVAKYGRNGSDEVTLSRERLECESGVWVARRVESSS